MCWAAGAVNVCNSKRVALIYGTDFEIKRSVLKFM